MRLLRPTSLYIFFFSVTFLWGGTLIAADQQQFLIISPNGKQISSVFEGLSPASQIQDNLKSKAVPAPNTLALKLKDSIVTQALGISVRSATSCPVGGICAQPGTASGPEVFCEDEFGCGVDVHNQADSDSFSSGTLELYNCSQCCVDWVTCTLSDGGDDPPPCDLRTGPQSGPCSPIILDLKGEGFHLTNAEGGVQFDMAGSGSPIQIAWTAKNFLNAFLVLDRNGNGKIDNGTELFGNVTPQPATASPNGFLALAQYDTNGDGVIDAKDPVYSQLRLWIDANHDGISQPEELHTLAEMGVFSISLKYSLSKMTDEFGNIFRYRSEINKGQSGRSSTDKKIYDVFFVTK